MSEKILSVFIDESGDFGLYEMHAPYYLVSMILHNQNTDISENIKVFDAHLSNLGYQHQAIHIGPLIRREELTKILTSVFSTLYTHVEFRKVKPVDYKLFQIADLICTMELLAEKAETNSFTRSEMEFFDNIRDFKKNYLKYIKKKTL